MHPEQTPTNLLNTGQVGYIACNMKDPTEGLFRYCLYHRKMVTVKTALVGDTLYRSGESVEPLPGFMPTKAMV